MKTTNFCAECRRETPLADLRFVPGDGRNKQVCGECVQQEQDEEQEA